MDLFYRMGRLGGQFVFLCTMRSHLLNAQAAERQGGYVLALTHLSHIEPMAASILMRRPVDWMTRKEFYKSRVVGWLLKACNEFKVNRQGIPVSAVRTAIERGRRGRVVGVCPEGGVAQGAASAMRGGPIRKGCCSVAIRAGVPILPCAMLGTNELNRVGPWLPFKRAKIWVAFGEPIYPAVGAASTRRSRADLAAKVSAAFEELYARLRLEYGIADSAVP